MKIRLRELFFIFFKISIVLIGGGYVLLPISIDEFSQKRKLLTKEEIIDFYALSQCLPGVIVVKTATFIGYHLRGKLGAFAALLGLITPPFFAILAIAFFIKSANPKIMEYLNLINISVIVLVGAAFVEIAQVCLKNIFTVLFFCLTVFMFAFTDIQPVVIIILLTLSGVLLKRVIKRYYGVEK